jgi:hypothetical protein
MVWAISGARSCATETSDKFVWKLLASSAGLPEGVTAAEHDQDLSM